jgi:pimeloyl-ACP methyl ester carboxylesterase
VSLGLGSPEAKSLRAKATEECRRQALETGADLSAYNTTESAADLEDLRTALDLPEWNVMGHSYGTQLTLTYMREYPEAIRAVALDGVIPPDIVSFGALYRGAGEGFDGMVEACEEQPSCRDAYPDLAETFDRLLREATEEPVETTVTTEEGERVKVVLDAATLVSWVIPASHEAADFPAAIDEMAQGDPQRLAEQWAGPKLNPEGFGHFSYGLLNSVTCAEWERGTEEEIAAGRDAFPNAPSSVWEQVPQLPLHDEDCEIWDVPTASSELRQATESDIPTLILNGSFDAQTAPSNGAHAAETLSNSTVVTIPGAAHGTFAESECSGEMIVSFFDDPDAPDTSCAEGLEPPEFNVE